MTLMSLSFVLLCACVNGAQWSNWVDGKGCNGGVALPSATSKLEASLGECRTLCFNKGALGQPICCYHLNDQTTTTDKISCWYTVNSNATRDKYNHGMIHKAVVQYPTGGPDVLTVAGILNKKYCTGAEYGSTVNKNSMENCRSHCLTYAASGAPYGTYCCAFDNDRSRCSMWSPGHVRHQASSTAKKTVSFSVARGIAGLNPSSAGSNGFRMNTNTGESEDSDSSDNAVSSNSPDSADCIPCSVPSRTLLFGDAAAVLEPSIDCC